VSAANSSGRPGGRTLNGFCGPRIGGCAIGPGDLKDYDYEVFGAASGVEAIKVWDECGGKIDLLLTDMVMPMASMAASWRETCARANRI